MTAHRTRAGRWSDPKGARDSEAVDALMHALQDDTTRRVARFLRENDGVAFGDDIVAHLSRLEGADREPLARELRHSVLPRMTDSGMVEYERETGLVIYNGDPFVEALLDLLGQWERTGRR